MKRLGPGPVTVPSWMSTRCVKIALNLDVHQSNQHTGTVFVSVLYSSLCMMSPQHLPELLEEFFFYRLYTSALLFLGFSPGPVTDGSEDIFE